MSRSCKPCTYLIRTDVTFPVTRYVLIIEVLQEFKKSPPVVVIAHDVHPFCPAIEDMCIRAYRGAFLAH